MFYQWHNVWHEQLEAALCDVSEVFDVTTALKELVGDRELLPHEKAVFRAFDYMLTPSRHASGDLPSPYAPMTVYDQGTYPERLEDATEDTLRAWADGTELSAHVSLAQARLGDLLWCRKFGDRAHQYARLAFAAMADLVQHSSGHAVARMDLLIRAIDLAAELGDQALREESVELAVDQATLSLENEVHEPGVTLGILERLVRLNRRHRPNELTSLLDRAHSRYGQDPFIREQCAELQLQVTQEPVERRRLVEQTIATWESKAEADGGLLAQHSLKRALDFARRYGTNADVDRLLSVLQSTPPDELQPISGTVNIERSKVDRFIDSFTTGDRAVWLPRFALYCPIEEDREGTHHAVRQLMQEHPISYLVSRVILNNEGLPIAHVQEPDEQFTAALRDRDSQGIQIWSLFATDVLERFAAEGVGASDFRAHFENSEGNAEEVDGFARAWERYIAGDHEEAALLCLPRVESRLRQLARNLGIVIYQEPRPERLGGYVGLGATLRLLEDRVPKDHRIYLQRLLCDPLSLNLRNRILHGLSLEVSKNEAALILHAVLLLGTWRLEVETPDEGAST